MSAHRCHRIILAVTARPRNHLFLTSWLSNISGELIWPSRCMHHGSGPRFRQKPWDYQKNHSRGATPASGGGSSKRKESVAKKKLNKVAPGNGSTSKHKSLFKPVPVTTNQTYLHDNSAGMELAGELDSEKVFTIVSAIFRNSTFRQLCRQNGLDDTLFYEIFKSFRQHCTETASLPSELHVVLADLVKGHGHIDDLWPYFFQHGRLVYPHLECIDDLKKISDLRKPPSWYPDARRKHRLVVYHAGPTNSGKTHHALHQFYRAGSGVYCGPLKLLACEVFAKANQAGTPCDLVTGEERRYASEDENSPAAHVACTVEMTSLDKQCTTRMLYPFPLRRRLSGLSNSQK